MPCFFKKTIDKGVLCAIIISADDKAPQYTNRAAKPALLRRLYIMAAIELHNIDVQAFLKEIDTCEGDVYLVTDEGDRLNLKSKLCQLIGLTKLIEGGKISNAHIECQNPEDETKLFRFNMFGNG